TSGVTCGDPTTATSYGYTYNAGGLRMSETSPGGTTQQFTWNTLSFVPQLLMDGSNAYIYGPQTSSLGNAPVEQISLSAPNSQSSASYLLSDPEGVRLTFNSSGTITAYASYDAYGNVIGGGLSSVTPFGYAGGYTDPTGLIYLVNRYYDPSTGQFLSVDPLVGVTDQPYQYVGGDPVNFTDPTGLACWAALELGFTQASRQCWKSGYKKAGHLAATHTLGWCVGGQAGYGYYVQFNLCAGTIHGRFSLWGSVGGGGGSPGAALNTGPFFSSASCPSQLEGPFAFTGASAGVGKIGAGAEGSVGGSGIWTFEPQYSFGERLPIPIPFETHSGVSYTDVWQP
ncbi:MAG: RHS repeat-associated core domain-containing protein, partial [Actinobacteria bacterium]|nr:RHS repeat-associated core domain-containing protein [Actinomycetota bacterium]